MAGTVTAIASPQPASLAPAASTQAPASMLGRVRWWLVQAYTQHGTAPSAQLADATSWLVLVSLLAIVLESAPELAERYGSWFFIMEAVVAGLFTADYVANVVLQENRKGYVFGTWGIIDLLAILPFFITVAHVFGDTGAARTLLALRALRVLRVLKLAKIAEEAAEEQQIGLAVQHFSFVRDLLFGMIGTCSVLAVAEAVGLDHEHQLYWLAVGGGFSFSVAARRWCVHHELSALAVTLALGTLMVGAAAAVLVDKAGDPGRATLTAVLSLLIMVASSMSIEGRDGAI